MADQEKKKNIFDRAIDALTNRDEKAAAEAAQKAAEEKKAAEAKAAEQAKFDAKRAELAAEKAKADAAAAAKKQAEEQQKKLDDMRMQQEREEQRKEQEAARARAAAAAEAAAKAAEAAKIKHVWTKEDTYASLAQKYYGSFQEPYWRLIYDHNKEIIGDHPNAIRVGLEIEIPPLPDELKK